VAALETTASLFDAESSALRQALTVRTMVTATDTMDIPLSGQQAVEAQEGLAKAAYSRTFDWVVGRLNQAVAPPGPAGAAAAAAGGAGLHTIGARGVASLSRGVLAAIYLCAACSCHEIMRRNGPGQACWTFSALRSSSRTPSSSCASTWRTRSCRGTSTTTSSSSR
jgi:hypothetical protein